MLRIFLPRSILYKASARLINPYPGPPATAEQSPDVSWFPSGVNIGCISRPFDSRVKSSRENRNKNDQERCGQNIFFLILVELGVSKRN